MNMKRLLAILLALCMMLCFAACGGDPETTDPAVTDPTPGATDPTNGDDPTDPTEPDDGLTAYVIKLTDESGNPIPGAWLQICNNAGCIPAMSATDETGTVTIRAAEGEYKVNVTIIPEGYTHVDPAVTDYYFVAGSTQIVIALKAVA